MRRALLLLAASAALATFAIAPAPAPQAGAQEPAVAAAAPERYRAAYRRWRQRLQRHGLFVGRNLLPEVRAAEGTSRPPSARELRRSIWRMQKRWNRWLRSSERGRTLLFERKVRKEVPSWAKAHLRSIARCESHGNPRAVGGGGTYRGLYQFSFSTWRVVGGYGDPAAASRWEQTWRAWLLLSRHGSGHWPVCG
jgi:hypothetical protein